MTTADDVPRPYRTLFNTFGRVPLNLVRTLTGGRIRVLLSLILLPFSPKFQRLNRMIEPLNVFPSSSALICVLTISVDLRFRYYRNYWSSTVAPASSSFFLSSAASSFLRPSLTGFGAPSTKSLASFNPSPVASFTALITLIF